VELGRKPSAKATEYRPLALGEPLEVGIFDEIDLLIHAAYDLTVRQRAAVWARNVVGTREIAERARLEGVRKVVLISSMSAYEGTEQIYGQAKLACENLVCRIGGTALRLGLVYEVGGGGMIGALAKLVKLPLVPVLGPGAHQYVVRANQVGPAVRSLVDAWQVPGEVVSLACRDAISFRQILASLAPPGRNPRFVDVPWKPVFGGMRLAEKVGICLPLRADSVLGLVHSASSVTNFEAWDELGVSIVPPPSLSPSGNR